MRARVGISARSSSLTSSHSSKTSLEVANSVPETSEETTGGVLSRESESATLLGMPGADLLDTPGPVARQPPITVPPRHSQCGIGDAATHREMTRRSGGTGHVSNRTIPGQPLAGMAEPAAMVAVAGYGAPRHDGGRVLCRLSTRRAAPAVCGA